jgi:endo-beta-N-acetylglucosaminidase D
MGKIAETTVSSPVASVILTGIDSTYDVYVVAYTNVQVTTDNVSFHLRVTESGTPNSSLNYDRAVKTLKSYATYGNDYQTNQAQWFIGQLGTPTQEQGNGIIYLFNMNSTTEYAFATFETSNFNSISSLSGEQGGGFFTVTGTARDGVEFTASSGNIDSGTFTLYGLNK